MRVAVPRSAAGRPLQHGTLGARVVTHITVLELLDTLCRYHHRLKTTKGWALVEGRGKRDFVPPTTRGTRAMAGPDVLPVLRPSAAKHRSLSWRMLSGRPHERAA